MVAIAIGCGLIAVPTLSTFYLGSAAFLTGSGLNFVCINCMVTQLFSAEDKRRETAFLWNYSGMNIGFFVGYTLAGLFEQNQHYATLFTISATLNIAALIVLVINARALVDVRTSYSENPHKIRANIQGLLLIALIFFGLRLLLQHPIASETMVITVAGLVLLGIALLAQRQTDISARKKLWAYWIFAIMSVIFWSIYQLLPNGLMLFLENNVNRHIYGYTIPPQWYINVNTIIIVIGAPLLGSIFSVLRKRGYAIQLSTQFSVALFFIGLSVLILPIAIHMANTQGYSQGWWPLVTGVLLSIGELCIGPIGYAMVGQLVPERLRGGLMGSWMMTIGAGVAIAGKFSSIAVANLNTTNPQITNPSYAHVFTLLGTTGLVAGIVLFILRSWLNQLIHSAHDESTIPH
jgi:POT family proton-dependent oligopeptide transporter